MPIELPPIQPTPNTPDTQLSRWFVVTRPATTPVVWADAKAQLRLDTDDDRTLVEMMIAAATDYAEESLASSLVSRTLLATFYGGEQIILPRGPLLNVNGIVDIRGNDVGRYTISHAGRSTRLTIVNGALFPVSVSYVAGYPTPAEIPAGIRLAILTHVATLYANRESATDRTKTVVPHSLVDFYRLFGRNTGVR